MAEAPVNSGSTSETGTSSGTGESAGSQNSTDSEAATDAPVEAGVTPGPQNSTEAGQVVAKTTPSPTPSAQAEKEEVKAVLSSPAFSTIFDADSKSKVLVFDQDYSAIGDNGLIARFTFNPTADKVFTNVRVEVEIDNYFFDFKPTNIQIISGEYSPEQDVYILVGDATYVYDEFGRQWSQSGLGKSRVKIEVSMEPNGTTVKSISLVMLGR
jgi:hypothetical protein